jgi:hypothetical protein
MTCIAPGVRVEWEMGNGKYGKKLLQLLNGRDTGSVKERVSHQRESYKTTTLLEGYMTHGEGGRGAGFKKEVHVLLLRKGGGAKGSTTGSTRGHQSGLKKPTMVL